MKFYAVQHGDSFEWDNGSTHYKQALNLANDYCRCPAYTGEEIRIATIDVENAICLGEEIIREGRRI